MTQRTSRERFLPKQGGFETRPYTGMFDRSDRMALPSCSTCVRIRKMQERTTLGLFQRLWCAAMFATLVAALGAAAAAAQSYPTRPIRLVVPFAAGGPADFLGRVVGQRLGEVLGQQVVVDNRPGANTILGAQAVAHAEPDGYTLLMAIDGTLVMNPFLYGKLPYDAVKDFQPISLIASVPSAWIANNAVTAKSVAELVAQEKAKPGTYLVGSSTPTTQVGIELVNMLAGVKLGIVPYKGGSTQVTGLLGGEILVGVESFNVALPLYGAGRLKILAVTTPARMTQASEIPPLADTYPGYDLGIWQSIVAPAGTPRAVVDKLAAAIRTVLSEEELRTKILNAGIEPALSRSPQEFAAFVRSQAEVRAKVIRAIGLKLD
jgi:tripartite-type tricarboxylate transporter receptor subunit TctC